MQATMTKPTAATARRTIHVVCGTTFGIVQENARCCGGNRFADVRLVGPVFRAGPGCWSHHEGQPMIRVDGEFHVAEWEGPADQIEAFAAEVAHMDHYSALHSSMRGVEATPAQRAFLGTCNLCDRNIV